MMRFPRGFVLPGGNRIKKCLEAAADYEVYSSVSNENVLIISSDLHEKLCGEKLIQKDLFSPLIADDGTECHFLSCDGRFILSSVRKVRFLCDRPKALAFANALMRARSITDVSLFDAIYVEKLSLLLPTYSQDAADDRTTLGTFLAGGVVISADSFDRLTRLAAFLTPSDLAEVIETAGFAVQRNGAYLAKQGYREREDAQEDGGPANRAAVKTGKFTLAGRPQLEEFINEHIVDILHNEEKYKQMGIDFPSAVILHGPPGCGKTFAVEKLIEFLGFPFYEINSSSIASSFIHETSKKVSEVFDKAIGNAPSVIVIDEMEAYLTDRGTGAASGMHRVEEVAEFLRRIPEATKNRVLIIAMTNMLEMIDPAILRRGRFDHIIEVSMPSKEEVEALVNALLEKLPTADDLDLRRMVDKLTGKPLSDASFAVREAARIAAKLGADEITNECIAEALNRLPKTAEKARIGF